jgi:hypothetical protein
VKGDGVKGERRHSERLEGEVGAFRVNGGGMKG